MNPTSMQNDNLKTSIDDNFRIINKLINDRKNAVDGNFYHHKNLAQYRYYDEQLITHLDATQNILKLIMERLDKLESNR